jgi:hypothetical protein
MVRTAPIIIPLSTHRKMIIARDAWNCQTRKEIATGAAFCTEKIETIKIMIIAIMMLIMVCDPLFFYLPT